MNTLTIDIGNSSCKADVWSDQGFIGRVWVGELNVSLILEKAGAYDVEAMIVSTVRKNTKHFLDGLTREFKGRVVSFDNKEISRWYKGINYKGEVGPDRIAAWLGARCFFPDSAMLVSDLGTAITIDVTDKEGNFCGGNISLGLNSRLKALAEAAGKLPEVSYYNCNLKFGKDTASAIMAGVVNGVTGELEYSVKLAKKLYDIKGIVTTGGDADKINIESDKYLKVINDPYLVGRGLNRHLRTNCLQKSYADSEKTPTAKTEPDYNKKSLVNS